MKTISVVAAPAVLALALAALVVSSATAESLLFREARTSPEAAGDGPNSIAAGDFDGDGDIDLAVANYSSHNVTILLNNGAANFRPAGSSPVPAGFNPFAIVAADLNGDGDIDLAVANSGSGDVTILNNVRGGGRFRESIESPVEIGFGSNPSAIVAVDVDRDGDADLAVVNQGDDNIAILRNDRRRFTVLTPIAVGDWPLAIAASDFDGDGDIDLAVANWFGNSVTILRNDLGGTFTQPPASPVATQAPYAIVAADLDGDGDIDLAVANRVASPTVTILRNQGGLSFAAVNTVTVGTTPVSITAADFDGDGDIDLAVANFGSDNVTILRNQGALAFAATAASPMPAGDGPISIAGADLNGDGDIDLAVAIQRSDNVTILNNR